MDGRKLYQQQVIMVRNARNIPHNDAQRLVHRWKSAGKLEEELAKLKHSKEILNESQNGHANGQANVESNDESPLVRPSAVELPEDVLSLSQIKIATLEREIDEQDKLIADKRRMLEAWQKIQSALQNV